MSSPQELEQDFWKALGSDKTVMLGLDGVEDGHARPMTAQFEDDHGPIYFFATTDNHLVQALGGGNRAIATFASKGHGLFATVHGRLSLDTNRAMIDRLWNSSVAAWYDGGKDDPKLALLRLDTEKAEIWQDGSSIMAGVKRLFGEDPKKDYEGHVATVSLT